MSKIVADIKDDAVQILEDGQSVSGNVLANDTKEVADTNQKLELTGPMIIKPGSLKNANGDVVADGSNTIQGKYGTLTLNSDGTYTYTLTKDMDYLGAGVDLHDEEFTYIVEYHELDNNGDLKDPDQDKTIEEKLRIDIHGVNDQVKISDVTVSTYEGGDHAGDVEVFNGTLTLGDVDPNTAGVQTDLDNGDTHTFKIVDGSLKVESGDVKKSLLTGVDVTVNADGTYSVTGDFDALSVGDTATVTFQYQVDEESTAGSHTLSDPKTVTLTVIGQNDSVEIKDDNIVTYDQLIDGDIYKSILANDGHYDPAFDPANPNQQQTMVNDMDVNDKLSIVSTGYHDLQFWQNGGQISVDNAEQTLEYTPNGGGAIAKDHFSFYYQATDGHTDPIGSAVAEFNMQNKNEEAIDFYQFGDKSSDTINGIAGKTNVLSGMKGNDKLYGKEKGDILYGGEGDDVLQGGWGDDIYVAGKGNDGIVDTRGNDMYVFSKGDGYNTVDDMNLEEYIDASGHTVHNYEGFDFTTGEDISKDIIVFDETVKESEFALFQEKGTQYDSLKLKYSTNYDDKVSVGWQPEKHYGIEYIAFDGADLDNLPDANAKPDAAHLLDDPNYQGYNDHILTKAEIELIVNAIATTDIDPNTAGLQTAQNEHDVQNSKILMDIIATYV